MGGTVRNRVFADQAQIEVDGGLFIGCDFRWAVFRYGGGELPRFQDCQFGDVSWHFTDAALRTIQFLQIINASPDGPAFIADLFQPGKMLTG